MNAQATETRNHVAVANEILSQIGGGRALFMLGAENPLALQEGKGALQIRFKGSRRYNTIRIILNVFDTYTVEFSKSTLSRKTFDYTVTNKVKYSDVQADSLVGIIESTTGLYLSLGTMGR